jgi:hypothetical protein
MMPEKCTLPYSPAKAQVEQEQGKKYAGERCMLEGNNDTIDQKAVSTRTKEDQ